MTAQARQPRQQMLPQVEQLLQRGGSVNRPLLSAIFNIFGQWHLAAVRNFLDAEQSGW